MTKCRLQQKFMYKRNRVQSIFQMNQRVSNPIASAGCPFIQAADGFIHTAL